MKTPLCEVCLSSDILCSGCQEKLETNKISQDEIDISRYLFNLSSKISSLKGVRLLKAVNTNNMLLMIAGKGDARKLVGKGGIVVKKLAKKMGKSIKVIEENNFSNFITDFFHPISIHGVNIVYTEGKESYRVRIPISHKNRLPIPHSTFSDIISGIYGKKAEIVFEK